MFNCRSLMMIVALVGSTGLTGCESKTDSNLAKAQACLDQAVPTTAAACTALVANDTSQKAYLIRCAGLYIKNGFVGDRVAQAFERIKQNPSGGTDPMLTALTLMAFTSTDEANLAKSYCTLSGVRSMERLATFTSMATLIGVNGLGTIDADGMTEAQVDAAINQVRDILNGSNGAEAAAALGQQLGEVAIQAEASYCNEGSSFKDKKVCTNLTNSIAAGNVADVALELLNQLQTN